MILSVSRRTDIPAFFPEWFINRVREGYAYVRNPFNASHIIRIPLGKDVVDCVVFWTKNPGPLMPHLPEIRRVYDGAFYFQYTMNAYGEDLEPGVPPLEERVASFQELSDTYGPERVVWRYDPILLTDTYTVDWHIRTFGALFSRLKGYTDTCVISFIDLYDKIKGRIKEHGIRAPGADEIDVLAKAFSEIARGSGVRIQTCAEEIDLSKYGIERGGCIDQARIERIIGSRIKARADKQRPGCLCVECADIGEYNTCPHGCRYCYANFSAAKAKNALAAHNDRSPLLVGEVPAGCAVREYSKAKSLKIDPEPGGQISLF